jgi:hypothetical protein
MDFTQSGSQEGGLASQRVMEMAISPTVGLGHLWLEMKGILAFVRQQRQSTKAKLKTNNQREAHDRSVWV